MKKIIEINDVNLGYKNEVILENIEITLNEGDFIIISGKNGLGKSTFLKFLYMKILPLSGSYKIFNNLINIKKKKTIIESRKKIGVIFQKNYLIPYLSVIQNVQLAFEIQESRSKFSVKRVFEILEWVGLHGKEKNKIINLSEGEKQKVVIARSLISNPKILIADEPMLYLDKISREKLFFLFKTINKLGTTIIVADDQNMSNYNCSSEINIESYVKKK